MAFNTTLCFVCWTIAILLLRGRGRVERAIHPLALTMGALGLLSTLGYIYQVGEYRSIFQYFPMAVNTTGCFLLAALALLFATPDRGMIKDLTGSGTGSITARRLIPFAFVAPIVLGWLRLFGTRSGAFTVEYGVLILVLSIIICFVLVIWYNARVLKPERRSRTEGPN